MFYVCQLLPSDLFGFFKWSSLKIPKNKGHLNPQKRSLKRKNTCRAYRFLGVFFRQVRSWKWWFSVFLRTPVRAPGEPGPWLTLTTDSPWLFGDFDVCLRGEYLYQVGPKTSYKYGYKWSLQGIKRGHMVMVPFITGFWPHLVGTWFFSAG